MKRFTWKDFILIPMIVAFLLIIIGEVVGLGILKLLGLSFTGQGFSSVFAMYFITIGPTIIFLLAIGLIKANRPMLKALLPQVKGNSLKMLALGLFAGFVLNGISILAAILHQDIHLSFDSFQPLLLAGMLFAVFIQSSSEEIVCRVYVYQRLRRGYRSPWVAIIGNAIFFMALHLGNPGMGLEAIIDIFISGLILSLLVFYTDGVWMSMGLHTAWNFTQNIIFGLPNSGIVTSFSIFKLIAANARNSIFYNVDFGVEGTIFSICILLAFCVFLIWQGEKKHLRDTDIWQQLEEKEV